MYVCMYVCIYLRMYAFKKNLMPNLRNLSTKHNAGLYVTSVTCSPRYIFEKTQVFTLTMVKLRY